jgi:phage terminase large subunit-like protein
MPNRQQEDPHMMRAAVALAALRQRLESQHVRVYTDDFEPYMYQRMPDDYILGEIDESGNLVPFWAWMLIGGRGSGKTRAGAHAVIQHLREFKEQARVACGAPTIGDARDVCAEGDSGLITKYKNEFKNYNRSLGEAYHELGGYVKFMGAETPDRWNGPQWSLIWCDELPLWNEESWEQAQFGLRLGKNPRAICTMTPKPKKFVRDLTKESGVVVYEGIPANINLSTRAKQRLYRRYGGTYLGRQELEGKFIDEVQGALFKQKWIDDARALIPELIPEFSQIVVIIDPAGSTNKTSADTGFAVVARGVDGDYYVLLAEGEQLSPARWAKRGINYYRKFQANALVAERNFGGDMVMSNIQQSDAFADDVVLRVVTASRGKEQRAEPVANLYEQKRVHHVGFFPTAEEQMVVFPVEKTKVDILDCIVWGVTFLSNPDNQEEDSDYSGPGIDVLSLERLTSGMGIRNRAFSLSTGIPGRNVLDRVNLDPYGNLTGL